MIDKTPLLPWILISLLVLNAAAAGMTIAVIAGGCLLLWLKLMDICRERDQ